MLMVVIDAVIDLWGFNGTRLVAYDYDQMTDNSIFDMHRWTPWLENPVRTCGPST